MVVLAQFLMEVDCRLQFTIYYLDIIRYVSAVYLTAISAYTAFCSYLYIAYFYISSFAYHQAQHREIVSQLLTYCAITNRTPIKIVTITQHHPIEQCL